MLPRTRLLCLFLGILTSSTQAGEVITLKAVTDKESPSFTVAAGESVRFLCASQLGSLAGSRAQLKVLMPEWGNAWQEFDLFSDQIKGLTFAGPATIAYSRPGTTPAFMSIELTRSGAFNPSIPTSSVVIPADQSGDFQVILESSTDMITWTQALPGTYSSSTVKRFFRTRIEHSH